MLTRGELVHDFEVTATDGRTVRYRGIWQRRNLVLVALPRGHVSAAYLAGLEERAADMAAHEAEYVATYDAIPQVATPGALVADRWGEVVFAAAPADVMELPAGEDFLEWLAFLQVRCPECEGEAR